MNRENYDSKLISTFEVIGSYFVDVFYNHLYLKARDFVKDGKYTSLTDAYKNNITNYTRGIKDEKHYLETVNQMHAYYQKVTAFSTLTFAEFENRILGCFIPQEYFGDFTERDKDSNLATIVKKSISELGLKILQPTLMRKIIDDHKNRANVVQLQDMMTEIFLLEREEYYVLYAKKFGQKSQKVPVELVEKLKKQLIEETKKRCNVESERDKAVNIIQQLVAKITEYEKKMADYERKIANIPNNDIDVANLSFNIAQLEKEKNSLSSANKNLIADKERLMSEKNNIAKERDNLVREKDLLLREKEEMRSQTIKQAPRAAPVVEYKLDDDSDRDTFKGDDNETDTDETSGSSEDEQELHKKRQEMLNKRVQENKNLKVKSEEKPSHFSFLDE